MSVRRYTRLVFFWKHALWLAALALAGVLVWIAGGGGGDAGRVVFTNMSQIPALQNVMEKPHYQGVSPRGEPYTVTSVRGTQIDEDTVALDGVRAEITQNGGDWIALNAAAGTLHIQDKKLELSGGVDVFYDAGYEARTEQAQVDIGQGTAYGDYRLEAQGPAGTLEADRFEIAERGQRLRFSGSVKVRLYRD